MIDEKEIENRFTYHPPKPDQASRYEVIRGMAKNLAKQFIVLTPESREQSLAITHLEYAVMCANAAIARRDP